MTQRPPLEVSRHIDETPDSQKLVTLVLGFSQIDLLLLPESIIPQNASVHFTTIAALLPEVFHDLQPRLIISPLMFHPCDASDVACRLSSLDYKGRYRVLTTAVPRPGMIQDELANAARNMTVELIDLCNA